MLIWVGVILVFFFVFVSLLKFFEVFVWMVVLIGMLMFDVCLIIK